MFSCIFRKLGVYVVVVNSVDVIFKAVSVIVPYVDPPEA